MIEAKKKGITLTGVETQSGKYVDGLPEGLPAWNTPLPFAYQSTGLETRFYQWPRSRTAFPACLFISSTGVDGGNLVDQTLKEFQQYVSPYNNFKFTEEYIVQRMSSNRLVSTARVCICT